MPVIREYYDLLKLASLNRDKDEIIAEAEIFESKNKNFINNVEWNSDKEREEKIKELTYNKRKFRRSIASN